MRYHIGKGSPPRVKGYQREKHAFEGQGISLVRFVNFVYCWTTRPTPVKSLQRSCIPRHLDRQLNFQSVNASRQKASLLKAEVNGEKKWRRKAEENRRQLGSFKSLSHRSFEWIPWCDWYGEQRS